MGYIGVYNSTIENFIIGKVRIGGLIIEKINFNELYHPNFSSKRFFCNWL